MDMCIACINDLPWLGHCCASCALPLAAHESRYCGRCQAGVSEINLSDIDHCVAALAYEFPVDRLITALKYQRKLPCARVLGELLAIRMHEARAINEMSMPTLLVPVPMHHWRLARRVYNHAEEIAYWLGRIHKLRVNAHVLRRIRNTPPQTGMSRAARLENLRGAFRARGDLGRQRIGLVDDVITTGSTVRELARLLKRQGAAEVQVWAVARTAS